MPKIAEKLSAHVCNLKYSDIPQSVIEKAKTALMHNFGVALAGYREVRGINETIKKYSSNDDGASLLIDGSVVSMTEAAFGNGVLMHSRGQDDSHMGCGCHIGAIVIPAALAVAERNKCTGREFLTAIIAGYETVITLGNNVAAISTKRGFRASTIYGPFGSAVAAGKLLGLNEAEMANAIGFVSNFGGGLNQCWLSGTPEWRIHIGMASRNGLTAALLASGGYQSSIESLEGDGGFYRAYTGAPPPDDLHARIGNEFNMHTVAFKPYPACTLQQTTVDLALRMIKNNDIRAEDIESVELILSESTYDYPGTKNKGPFTGFGAAHMSAYFCLASSIANREMKMEQLCYFQDEAVADLIEKITLVPNPELNGRECIIAIKKKDGVVIKDQFFPDGTSFNFTREEAISLIKSLQPEMPVSVERLEQLLKTIHDIEDLDSVVDLIRATKPD